MVYNNHLVATFLYKNILAYFIH